MAPYRLFKHKFYEKSAEKLPPSTRRKALWAQVLLGTRGRTPLVKGTTGLNAHWRRTPVQGNHYYMWWIPQSEVHRDIGYHPPAEPDEPNTRQDQKILVHSIRHHDETDNPIDFGSLDDYEEIPIGTLDPRYEEQADVSLHAQISRFSLSTIMGLPGSGKTISLLYLARDLAQSTEHQNILYLTYTNRLKRAAAEFLQAQSESLSAKIRVATLGEIESELTKLAAQQEPFGELTRFENFLGVQSNSVLGPWRRYPQTLFTEVRAQLLGKTFPNNYPLPESRGGELLTYQNGLDGAAYATSRGLTLENAELACRLAERAQDAHFFQDQLAAYMAIQQLMKGRGPNWLAKLDALVIDEVQDLTLLQIAMVGSMVSERLRRRSDAPFAFVVAGDESQIVQPSGFDWGVTKDVLSAQLNTHPQDFEFSYQRRSPRNLAQLIDHSWELYSNLPKRLRPSGRRRAFLYDTVGENASDEGNGEIYLCTPRPLPEKQGQQSQDDWQALLTELIAKPGRVIVDLSETLTDKLDAQMQSQQGNDEAIFLPREIKGLERTTVLLYGLNALYERAMHLCHNDNHNDTIPYFEARRIFDEMRVALSRSTDRLIILEAPDAPVVAALAMESVPNVNRIRWLDLIDSLETEELSTLEVIQGYLEEVDDFFERGMWEQGYRRNRRAHELALQEGDEALRREAEEQFITGNIDEAQRLLADQRWLEAHGVNRRVSKLANRYGYPDFIDDVSIQYREITSAIAADVNQRLRTALQQIEENRYYQAHDEVQAAMELAWLTEDKDLHTRVDEAAAMISWRWAALLLEHGDTPDTIPRVIKLFEEAAAAMHRQGDTLGTQALQSLVDRYRELPPKANYSKAETENLLTHTDRYLQLIGPLQLDSEAYVYIERWLEESFSEVRRHVDLYHSWATLAQSYARITPYATFDDHVWELENQLTLLIERGKQSPDNPTVMRFRAFVAAYDERPEASILYEKLGETELAVRAARAAGELEHAYTLYRKSDEEIPDELGATVKAVRQLRELHQKHRRLYPAERQALLDAIRALEIELMAQPLTRDEEEW